MDSSIVIVSIIAFLFIVGVFCIIMSMIYDKDDYDLQVIERKIKQQKYSSDIIAIFDDYNESDNASVIIED